MTQEQLRGVAQLINRKRRIEGLNVQELADKAGVPSHGIDSAIYKTRPVTPGVKHYRVMAWPRFLKIIRALDIDIQDIYDLI